MLSFAECGCTLLYFVSVQRLEHFLELLPRFTLMWSLAFRSCVCVACVRACVCVCVPTDKLCLVTVMYSLFCNKFRGCHSCNSWLPYDVTC